MAGSSSSTRVRKFLALILPLLLAFASSANADGTASDNIVVSKVKNQKSTEPLPQIDDSCQMLEGCKLCDSMQRNDIPECAASGRVEIWHCTGNSEVSSPTTAGAGTVPRYRSCKRTKADEEFLMIRLQVMWVVIGTAAFVSARKQKVVSASLFDQRKLAAAAQEAKRRRRDSSNVEMVSMEETVPLTAEDDSVDVV